MSVESVKKFYDLALKDEELKIDLQKINERITVAPSDFMGIKKLVEREILPLAQKRGLDFTADELLSFKNEKYTELSEEDLLEVNGGFSPRNTAIGLSTVLLLSLGSTAAINFLSSNNDLTPSITISAPAETSENESQTNEEDARDSQNKEKIEKSEEKDTQNNSSEETSGRVQQSEQAKQSENNKNDENIDAQKVTEAGSNTATEETEQNGNNNISNEAAEVEAEEENVNDAEETMPRDDESIFGGMQDVFDEGRFDGEGEESAETEVRQEGIKAKIPYNNQSFFESAKSHEELVAELASYLKSIDRDLNRVPENDQERLKEDVKEVVGWISSEKGPNDTVIYKVSNMSGKTQISKDDYDIINAFAKENNLTDDDNDEELVEETPDAINKEQQNGVDKNIDSNESKGDQRPGTGPEKHVEQKGDDEEADADEPEISDETQGDNEEADAEEPETSDYTQDDDKKQEDDPSEDVAAEILIARRDTEANADEPEGLDNTQGDDEEQKDDPSEDVAVEVLVAKRDTQAAAPRVEPAKVPVPPVETSDAGVQVAPTAKDVGEAETHLVEETDASSQEDSTGTTEAAIEAAAPPVEASDAGVPGASKVESEESILESMNSVNNEKKAYKGQFLFGNAKPRTTLVKELADYLRSIDGNLDNVKGSDQAKLKQDVQEALGWISKKANGSGYVVKKWGLLGRLVRSGDVKEADYDAIMAFASKYGYTEYAGEEAGAVKADPDTQADPELPVAELSDNELVEERVSDSVRRFIPGQLGLGEGTERSSLHYRRDIQNNAEPPTNAVGEVEDLQQPEYEPAGGPGAAVTDGESMREEEEAPSDVRDSEVETASSSVSTAEAAVQGEVARAVDAGVQVAPTAVDAEVQGETAGTAEAGVQGDIAAAVDAGVQVAPTAVDAGVQGENAGTAEAGVQGEKAVAVDAKGQGDIATTVDAGVQGETAGTDEAADGPGAALTNGESMGEGEEAPSDGDARDGKVEAAVKGHEVSEAPRDVDGETAEEEGPMLGGMQDDFDQGRFDYEEEENSMAQRAEAVEAAAPPVEEGDAGGPGASESEADEQGGNAGTAEAAIEAAAPPVEKESVGEHEDALPGGEQEAEVNEIHYEAPPRFLTEKMVKYVVNYLRRVSGNMENVPEGDREKLREDIEFLNRMIAFDISSSKYGIYDIDHKFIELSEADKDAIYEFNSHNKWRNPQKYGKYDATTGNEDGGKNQEADRNAKAPYQAPVVRTFNPRIGERIREVVRYLDFINGDIEHVEDSGREALRQEVADLLGHITYDGQENCWKAPLPFNKGLMKLDEYQIKALKTFDGKYNEGQNGL